MEKNLIRVASNTAIYRIFPRNRVIQALTENRLVLVKPASWDDPFENFLLQAKAYVGKEVASLEPLRNKLYGQCWMQCGESDAMWRIYSKPPTKVAPHLTDEVGVKVRTTVGKVFSALYDSSEKLPELCCWAGAVTYLSQVEMSALVTSNKLTDWITDQTGKGHAESLLLKRDAFSHEHEVRFIFAANNGYDPEQAIYPFGIEPSKIFEEMILDPRLSKDHCNELGQAVRQAGYKGPVSQSSLYLPPQFTVTIAENG